MFGLSYDFGKKETPLLVLLGELDRQLLDAIVAQIEGAKIFVRVEQGFRHFLDVVLAEEHVRQISALP